MHVWDEFSEFLPENRVPTSADFNTYPIRIFYIHPIPCQELRMRQSYNAESFYNNKVRYVEHLMLYFLAILQ